MTIENAVNELTTAVTALTEEVTGNNDTMTEFAAQGPYPAFNSTGSLGRSDKRYAVGYVNTIEATTLNCQTINAGGNGLYNGYVKTNAPAGFFKYFGVTTDGSPRWDWGASNAPETGGNVGSNFFITAFDDNGYFKATPFSIDRATGNIGIDGAADAPQSSLHVHTIGDKHTQIISNDNANWAPSLVSADNESFANIIQYLRCMRPASGSYSFAEYVADYNGTPDCKIRFTDTGNIQIDGAVSTPAADYAELFEYSDENPDEENRAGWSVTLDNGKIRQTESGETPIGVITRRAGIIGDAGDLSWKEKFLSDVFGAPLFEDYQVVQWDEVIEDTAEVTIHDYIEVTENVTKTEIQDGKAVLVTVPVTSKKYKYTYYPVFDENGVAVLDDDNKAVLHAEPVMVNKTIVTGTRTIPHSHAVDNLPADIQVPDDAQYSTQTRRKLNPDFDPNLDYIPRTDRPEWDTVALLGKVFILKGEQTAPNWVKLRDISDTVEEWLIR